MHVEWIIGLRGGCLKFRINARSRKIVENPFYQRMSILNIPPCRLIFDWIVDGTRNTCKFRRGIQIAPAVLPCYEIHVISSEKLSPSHLRHELRWQFSTIFLGHSVAPERILWYINKFPNGETRAYRIALRVNRVSIRNFLRVLEFLFIQLMSREHEHYYIVTIFQNLIFQ